MQDEVMELLTQGSVWTRNEGQKEGSQVKVLWITNTSLGNKAQAKHPPQVVYASVDGNVYNRDIESFVAQYSFYNVDPDLEGRLDSLLTFNEGDYEDEEESDEEVSIDSNEESEEQEQEQQLAAPKSLADMLASEDEDESTTDLLASALEQHESSDFVFHHTEVGFVMSQGENTAIDPEVLTSSLVACAQEPNKEMSFLQTRLLFRLSDEVSVEKLTQAFMPLGDDSGIDAITIAGPYFSQVIAWTDFVGVFPEVAQGIAYASVIIGEGNSKEQEDQALNEEEFVINEVLVESQTEVVQEQEIIQPLSQTEAPAEHSAPTVVVSTQTVGFTPQVVHVHPQ